MTKLVVDIEVNVNGGVQVHVQVHVQVNVNLERCVRDSRRALVHRLHALGVMQETVTGAESSEYRSLAKQSWQRFFDAVTNALEGRETEVEVISLGLGDQIEAEWIPLNGLTYDPHADTFYVYLEDVERDLAHAIPSPRDIAVRFTGAGLEQVAVKDAEGTLRVIRLRMPMQLELPERV